MTEPHSSILNTVVDDLRKAPIPLGAMLVIATLLLYGQVTHHEFLQYDDYDYVTNNVHVNTGFTLENVTWAFTSIDANNWHPVTWFSHMADCQLFGLAAGAHHLVNVFLHAANALLLFLLLVKATGAVWRSVLVAGLFVVHPLNVENVAWVAERKSLLCTFFVLLTIAAYGWYASRPNLKRYLVVVAAYALALMSKPLAVTLPVVLLLLDQWPLERYDNLPFGRKWARLLMEKLPLLSMSVASSAVTIIAQRSGGSIIRLADEPLSMRFENAVVSYAAYVGKVLWPAKLAVLYPLPEHALPWFEVAGSMLALVLITIAALYFHRTRYFVVGWFLFIVTLIPVIGIVQTGNQAMADRHAYIPSIGLFIIIAWGLNDLKDHAGMRSPFVPASASLFLILALATATTQYLNYWQNGVKLFTRASVVAVQPNAAIEGGLADALLFAGRHDEAYEHYKEECVLQPKLDDCHFNMAVILSGDRREPLAALEEFQLALKYTDSKKLAVSCLVNSGWILLHQGDYGNARVALGNALKLDPTNKDILQLLRQAAGN